MIAEEIEVLYYYLQNNVILGQKERSRTYLNILRHEYNVNEDNFNLLQQDDRFENLIKLGQIVDNGLLIKQLEFEESKIDYNFDRTQDTIKETHLKELLVKEDIGKLLDSKSFRFLGTEFETRYGRVDLVGQDENTLYVFELKKTHADHKVLGQIEKYLIHYKLKLINKMYKYVVGIVVANTFDNYSLNELQRNNVICLKYSLNEDKINVGRLK